jgi:elongation factor Ts
MAISVEMIKDLREKTGAGMMDCKKALVEANGDMTKATEILRQKGIASADKKMDRIAAEGIVTSFVNDSCGALVELNCETDFVAKNADFKELASNLAKFVAESNPSDVDALLNSTCPVSGKAISDVIKEKIAKIGEKITFRRFVRYEGNTSTYIHNGKIGVLLNTDTKDEELMNDVCLHIASMAPEFISSADIPSSVIEHEKEVEMGKEDLLKKPEAIRAKIVEGRIHKLLASRCLLEQSFVKDPNMTVGDLIKGKMNVKSFTRFQLGEGLEKRSENFADEVMSQIGA